MEIKNLTKEEYEIAMEVINQKRKEDEEKLKTSRRLLALKEFAIISINEIGLAKTKEMFRTINRELREIRELN